MEVKSLFEKAVAESNHINSRPSKETLLHLYSLYKQATEGDINMAPPENPFDFEEKAKFDAWLSLKGKPVKDAQREYISLVNKLKS